MSSSNYSSSSSDSDFSPIKSDKQGKTIGLRLKDIISRKKLEKLQEKTDLIRKSIKRKKRNSLNIKPKSPKLGRNLNLSRKKRRSKIKSLRNKKKKSPSPLKRLNRKEILRLDPHNLELYLNALSRGEFKPPKAIPGAPTRTLKNLHR